MTPPGGSPTQTDEPRGLRGDAVARYELLLLAHRPQKAERVHPEADDPHQHEREQARHGGEEHP
jgi:hypothetical protein